MKLALHNTISKAFFIVRIKCTVFFILIVNAPFTPILAENKPQNKHTVLPSAGLGDADFQATLFAFILPGGQRGKRGRVWRKSRITSSGWLHTMDGWAHCLHKHCLTCKSCRIHCKTTTVLHMCSYHTDSQSVWKRLFSLSTHKFTVKTITRA